MPDDSYVLKYFKYMNKYLSVGPPFYIVVNSTHGKYNFSNYEIQNRICGSEGCNTQSLQAQVIIDFFHFPFNTCFYKYIDCMKVMLWSKQPDITYIASPAQSWIDDYFVWSFSW